MYADGGACQYNRGSQRWIYRIDPKRVNEYGQVMGSDVDAVQKEGGKKDTETKKNK